MFRVQLNLAWARPLELEVVLDRTAQRGRFGLFAEVDLAAIDQDSEYSFSYHMVGRNAANINLQLQHCFSDVVGTNAACLHS